MFLQLESLFYWIAAGKHLGITTDLGESKMRHDGAFI